MTILNTLYSNNPLINIWKYESTITTYSNENGISTGKSSILIKLNELPKSGSCSITPLTGFSANTSFTISCRDWVDNDGLITKYAYYGTC